MRAIFCRFGRHLVDGSDYLTQTGPGGETFIYCTSHEPLTQLRREKLEAWAAPWKDGPAPEPEGQV